MTYIEFFDKDAVENICSCFVHVPEKVILIGDNKKLMEKHKLRYKDVLLARGIDVEFVCCAVNKNRMETIVETLSMIVEENLNCVFDLTGGEDLYLVATGIVFEKFKDRNVQMHRINIRNGAIIDVDQDGTTILAEKEPKLTIEENIKIYGGNVISNEKREDTTPNWDMSADFENDINAMWKICRQDVRLWNTQINVFEIAEKMNGQREKLRLCVPLDRLTETIERDGSNYVLIQRITHGLKKAGLLRSVSADNNVFVVEFKNEQVKRCLTIAGRVLELKVYLAALKAEEKDGTPTYHDVKNGVNIDWDGEQNAFGTENEIDLMTMHGLVPVFVSCKNGFFDNNELYKLNTVATRFGGKYAKKVLIATGLDDTDFSNYIRQRANDMGIRLVEGYKKNGEEISFAKMADSEIVKVMRTLWSS